MDTRKIALKEDDMELSKQDVIDMIRGLVIRSKRGKQNLWSKAYRGTLHGLRATMEMVPEKIVKMMWNDILRFFNHLITYNTLLKEEKELGNESPLKKTFSKLKQEVKEGNW